MNYYEKYLKYKTKYLSLKSQFISKNLMTGGSNDNSFENLDLFSETITSPSIDANFKLVSLLNKLVNTSESKTIYLTNNISLAKNTAMDKMSKDNEKCTNIQDEKKQSKISKLAEGLFN